jgi:hypothetical protein
MKTRLIFAIGMLIAAICYAEEKEKEHRYKMSLNDEFVVNPKESWTVMEQKYLTLRFANVEIAPKKGSAFSLMLYFKCDTPDLAQFESMEKIEKSVKASSEQYLRDAVEKTLTIKNIREGEKVGYGCYVVLTDAEVAKKSDIPEGEFKYIVRGMIRLSPDSALGFSLMVNELDGPAYKELMDYIQSFVKKDETKQS